jgi:aspartyl/asparaginyl beta-hydroxylase (cupin superfamily)
MFVETQQFEFVAALEANWHVIRDEYLALSPNAFEPWVQREMYGTGWQVYGFYAFGEKIAPALQRCPKTAAILAAIPGLTTAGFSQLAPQAHIQPHVGWVSTVYRAHLGLVTPPACGLRVGSETRSWAAGKCLIFDDTVEHEAWNKSAETRTVLLFDFLRPGVPTQQADIAPPAVQAFVQETLRKHSKK